MKINFEISTSLISNIVGLIGLLILMVALKWPFWIYLGVVLLWASFTTITQNLEDQVKAMHTCLHNGNHNKKNGDQSRGVKMLKLNPEDTKKLIEGLSKNNAKN